jgi:CelD/BcsL family acetyltransferase involved in cellulose biosynthesis
VLRHEGRPVFIWPLLVERRAFVRVVSAAGAPVSQYDEILLDPGVDAKAVFAAALTVLADIIEPDLVLLERVRADSQLRAALGETAPFCWGEAAPYADLSRGMDAVLSNQRGNTARNQRKRIKRFEGAGHSAFAVAGDPAESEAWLLEALALKRNWLHETGRLSRAFVQCKTVSCLTDLARTMSHADTQQRLVVSRLSLDGRTAAIEAGFVHRGTYHLYLGAFAPEFAKLGPGNILTQRVLEWCVKNGIERYDMMAPRSRHKSEWQSGEVGVVDFALPMTLSGRLYASLVLKRLAPMLRRAFYALPAGPRSTVAGMTLRI